MSRIGVHIQEGTSQTSKHWIEISIHNGNEVSVSEVVQAIDDLVHQHAPDLSQAHEIENLKQKIFNSQGHYFMGGGFGHNGLTTREIAGTSIHVDIEVSGEIKFV